MPSPHLRLSAVSSRRSRLAVMLSAALVAGVWVAAPSAQGAGPANDDYADAQVISGTAGSLTASTVGSTTENGDGEPEYYAGEVQAENSIWYSWTAPATGQVTFDTSGVDYDREGNQSALAVYADEDGTLANSSPLVFNGSCRITDPFAVLSQYTCLNLSAFVGRTYYIGVTTGLDGGDVALNWKQTARSTAPTSLGATATATVATLNWSPPSNSGSTAVTSYMVRAERADGTVVSTVTAPSTAQSQTFSGLSPSTSYTLRVAAMSAGGAGEVASISITTPAAATVPGAPTIGTAVAGTGGGAITATANWSAPSSNGGTAITGYQVSALRINSNGSVASTTVSAVQSATTRTLSMTLPQSGNYRFTVVAINAVGSSRASARSNQVAGR